MTEWVGFSTPEETVQGGNQFRDEQQIYHAFVRRGFNVWKELKEDCCE